MTSFDRLLRKQIQKQKEDSNEDRRRAEISASGRAGLRRRQPTNQMHASSRIDIESTPQIPQSDTETPIWRGPDVSGDEDSSEPKNAPQLRP